MGKLDAVAVGLAFLRLVSCCWNGIGGKFDDVAFRARLTAQISGNSARRSSLWGGFDYGGRLGRFFRNFSYGRWHRLDQWLGHRNFLVRQFGATFKQQAGDMLVFGPSRKTQGGAITFRRGGVDVSPVFKKRQNNVVVAGKTGCA